MYFVLLLKALPIFPLLSSVLVAPSHGSVPCSAPSSCCPYGGATVAVPNGHLARDDRACTYNGTVADSYTRQHDHIGTYPTAVADGDGLGKRAPAIGSACGIPVGGEAIGEFYRMAGCGQVDAGAMSTSLPMVMRLQSMNVQLRLTDTFEPM